MFPFVEQQGLYDGLDVPNRTASEYRDLLAAGSAVDYTTVVIDGFICPSCDVVKIGNSNSDYWGLKIAGVRCDTAKNNYVSICGQRHHSGRGADGKPTQSHCLGSILPEGKDVRFADIIDGTSNVFLFGEAGGSFAAVSQFLYGTSTSHSVKYARTVGWPLNGVSFNSQLRGASSMHPGGANFALVDGSVRFISETIEFSNNGRPAAVGGGDAAAYTKLTLAAAPGMGVYQHLGMRKDRQPLGSF